MLIKEKSSQNSENIAENIIPYRFPGAPSIPSTYHLKEAERIACAASGPFPPASPFCRRIFCKSKPRLIIQAVSTSATSRRVWCKIICAPRVGAEMRGFNVSEKLLVILFNISLFLISEKQSQWKCETQLNNKLIYNDIIIILSFQVPKIFKTLFEFYTQS